MELKVDRRDTVAVFRDRLVEVILRSGQTHAGFARQVGMDRSTLSQLLAPGNDRLPRVETVAAIAASQKVSTDWLLGLSNHGHLGADIMSESAQIERNAALPTDQRLMRWQAEAGAFKIRHVPTTLPDLLKTETVIRYEYGHLEYADPEVGIEAAQTKLALQRRPETDMEVCTSLQSVAAFARGEQMWGDLPAADRAEQLRYMIALADELYPTFRWFLFDLREHYSAPITVFGPQRAVIYIGQMYFVFNSTEHIRALTQHFDGLIRAAIIQPTQVGDMLRGLLAELRA